MEWYIYAIIIVLVAFAFRKQILSFVGEYYKKYKETQKYREMMQRLYRNGEGRWDQKAYLKGLDAQKKKQRKAMREKQEDAK